MAWKTALTKIGKDEKESIRGFGLQELIEKKTFVEVIFLLLKGELPSKKEAQMMNALFTACIDHGIGAPSATVARTAASTGNSLHSALAAGILTTGEHHGLAIEGAARFFSEHKGVGDLAGLLGALKEKKIRVPGFGHKVLTTDHRSVTLFAVAKKNGFFKEHCTFALKVEKALNIISSKKLPLNIDGSMAAILLDMGFDWKVAKGFFLIGRVPGLVAHIYEEMTTGDGLKRIAEKDIEYTGESNRKV